jgi:hypothetical protein
MIALQLSHVCRQRYFMVLVPYTRVCTRAQWVVYNPGCPAVKMFTRELTDSGSQGHDTARVRTGLKYHGC